MFDEFRHHTFILAIDRLLLALTVVGEHVSECFGLLLVRKAWCYETTHTVCPRLRVISG